MTENGQYPEPTYATKIPPKKHFLIIFLMGIGFISIPILFLLFILFSYLLINGEHFVMYAVCLTALSFIVIGGLYFTRLLYREVKRRVIDNKYPSGFDLLEDKLCYQRYDSDTNRYIFGEILYTQMEKCVISVNSEPVLGPRAGGKGMEIKGYHFKAVANIIFMDKDELNYYTTIMETEDTKTDVITMLQKHNVQVEITQYDLRFVPDEKRIQVLLEDIQTEPLEEERTLEKIIVYNQQYTEDVERYRDAYTEWLVEERGILQSQLKPWHACIILLAFCLVASFGWVGQQSHVLLTMTVPYVIVAASYMLFIYTIKDVKYWKTIIHMFITLLLLSILLTVVGHNPFQFYKEANMMFNIQDPIAQYVIGTVLGFYGGSYMFYIYTNETIRRRWPAVFHKEVNKMIDDF